MTELAELFEIGQELLLAVESLLDLVTQVVSFLLEGCDALLVVKDIVVQLDVL